MAAEVGHDGVEIYGTQKGVALQVFGGTVRATKADALTIPIHPLAHGKRARGPELKGRLFKFKSKKGNTLLALKETGEPLFVLKRAATIKGDREKMPSDDAIVDTAAAAVDEYFAYLYR